MELAKKHRSAPLEKRRYSITRLKLEKTASHTVDAGLEKRRYSITRLKLFCGIPERFNTVRLKREDTRLRDWNVSPTPPHRPQSRPWKEKILDYEIETCSNVLRERHTLSWKEKILDYEIETELSRYSVFVSSDSWKEKILDYEIETRFLFRNDTPFYSLEKRRYSITRLKLSWDVMRADAITSLKREDTRLRDWNSTAGIGLFGWKSLEKRRYSITRLKLCVATYSQHPSRTWKEKILDYEIETGVQYAHVFGSPIPWKEKILDYEIETQSLPLTLQRHLWQLEKRRYSITRLKPADIDAAIDIGVCKVFGSIPYSIHFSPTKTRDPHT